MVTRNVLKIFSQLAIFLIIISQQSAGHEDGYLRYVKDGCFIKREALSCVKYKALKLATNVIFGEPGFNETIRANNILSLVPIDPELVPSSVEDVDLSRNFGETRAFTSEWAELTKYGVKIVKDFFKSKGLRVSLPEGARAIEENTDDLEDGRGRKKKLAVILPFLSLLATLKTKMLLIPVLLAVFFIKKLLLLAALLLPGLLSTLKACKTHHPTSFYSHWGNSDTSDFSSGYGNNFAYSSGGGYGKDWAANRAYTLPKARPTPVYITAPGAVA